MDGRFLHNLITLFKCAICTTQNGWLIGNQDNKSRGRRQSLFVKCNIHNVHGKHEKNKESGTIICIWTRNLDLSNKKQDC